MAKKKTKKLEGELAALLVPDKKDNQVARSLQLKKALVVHSRKKSWSKLFKQRYEETENPLAIWDCYLHARKLGEPVPEFVHVYLERAAENLLNTDNNLKTVGRCLELNIKKKNKGGHSAFTQYADHLERRKAVFAVYQAINDKPELEIDDVCDAIARKHNLVVDGGTVKKWYYTVKL